MEPLRYEVEEAVAALRTGRPVILPTDTVYGLCANPYSEEPVRRAYKLKGRDPHQPSALLARAAWKSAKRRERPGVASCATSALTA